MYLISIITASVYFNVDQSKVTYETCHVCKIFSGFCECLQNCIFGVVTLNLKVTVNILYLGHFFTINWMWLFDSSVIWPSVHSTSELLSGYLTKNPQLLKYTEGTSFINLRSDAWRWRLFEPLSIMLANVQIFTIALVIVLEPEYHFQNTYFDCLVWSPKGSWWDFSFAVPFQNVLCYLAKCLALCFVNKKSNSHVILACCFEGAAVQIDIGDGSEGMKGKKNSLLGENAKLNTW